MERKITGHTGLACILGNPVAHSISPLMHNEAFQQSGLDYVYLAFKTGPDTFNSTIEGLKSLNAVGWNCTMPLKRMMYEKCDTVSETARLIGAVNTVRNDDGTLYGHNTDGYGFMQSVRDAGHEIAGSSMTLLGTGGASAAIIAQAALDGISELTIFARSGSASTQQIRDEIKRIQEVSPCIISLYDLTDLVQLRNSISKSKFLINASSVGMASDESLINDTALFHKGLVVGDVIYDPAETRLLRIARECGCATFNGMYMLLHQGAAAFKLWTGLDMPVEIIREKYFKDR